MYIPPPTAFRQRPPPASHSQTHAADACCIPSIALASSLALTG